MRILKLFLILLFFNNLHSQSKVFSVEEAQKIGINIEKLDLEYKSAVHIDSTKAVFRTEAQQQKLQESYICLLYTSLIQQQFQLLMITPTLAYPVEFSILNVLIVFLTIVSLGIIASLIASSRVTKKLLD